MDSSVSAKEEIWFLRLCHHISNAVYLKERLQLTVQITFPSLVRHSVTFVPDICALNEVKELCIAEVQSSCNVIVGECPTRQN
jgi:hypothetical protein